MAGEKVIPCQYEYADHFFEGLARVSLNGKFGYITPSGEMAIDFLYDDCKEFTEGLASITLDNKQGYINSLGKIVIEPAFQYANPFGEGLAQVKPMGSEKWEFVDYQGKLAIDLQFDSILVVDSLFDRKAFSGGYAAVGIKQHTSKKSIEKMGYIDANGDWFIKPEFDICGPFSNGLAAIQIGDTYGFINLKGETVIPLQYEGMISKFSEGIAFVMIGEYWGGINLRNETVIAPQYEFTLPFREGLAAVKLKEKYGYINKNQQFVIEPSFLKAGVFRNGIAKVLIKKDSQMSHKDALAKSAYDWAYINKSGDILWKSE